jgi:hypothetical protein
MIMQTINAAFRQLPQKNVEGKRMSSAPEMVNTPIIFIRALLRCMPSNIAMFSGIGLSADQPCFKPNNQCNVYYFKYHIHHFLLVKEI